MGIRIRKGIYNVMNKGVKVACGLYCQFLNSGDWLYCELLFNEVSCIPTDVVWSYSQLKKSFKAKKQITNILRALITLYNLIKATGIIPLRRRQK